MNISLSTDAERDDTPLSLLDGLRQNDESAWSRLVELWTPLIYGSCRSRGFSSVDSDDIAQTVIVRVYKGLPGFHRDGAGRRFRFWIMKILRNEIARFCQQNSDRPAAAGGSDHQVILQNLSESESPSDSDWFSPARVVARALEVIRNDFDEKNWHAFELVEFEKLPNQEVADRLGMTANSVRQATFRIRKRLKQELEGMLE